MTKLNHKSRNQTRKKIEPSSRDSISTWLDVLTAMLVMPDTQRAQVRDELEDHLRSRADDLLIIGKPEPEAIRIAVAELGETAELAKLITHAHTKSNPRRKIMNAALITVALAGMSFGGYSIINGTGAPGATPSNGGVVPVVVVDQEKEGAANEPIKEERKLLLAIEGIPTLMAFEQIATSFGYTIDIHSLDTRIVSDLQNRHVDVVGEMDIKQALQLMRMQTIQHAAELVLVVGDDVIELLTQNEAIRRTVTTSVNPAPSWINEDHQRARYAESIQDLLRVKHDLEFTSIQIIGKSFVVAAPPEIHADVDRIAKELNLITERDYAERAERTKLYEAKRDAEQKAREVERKNRSEKIAVHKKAEHEQAIKRIQVEFDRVRTELIQKKTMMEELVSRLGVLDNAFDPELSTRRHDRERSEIEEALVDTELLYEEYQSRYNYLRDTLIESEYAVLFEGLN